MCHRQSLSGAGKICRTSLLPHKTGICFTRTYKYIPRNIGYRRTVEGKLAKIMHFITEYSYVCKELLFDKAVSEHEMFVAVLPPTKFSPN